MQRPNKFLRVPLEVQECRGGKKLPSENIENGSEKKNKGALHGMLYVVFISMLLDLLAFTLILPLLPALLDHYSSQGQGELYSFLSDGVQSFQAFIGAPVTARWNSVLFGGFIGSLFSFSQFLASPVIGMASDIYGRRCLMLISMIGVASSYFLWAFSSNFTLFVLSRIICGICKGNVSLSTAIVTDVSTPEKRGRGMALIGIAFSVGFVFGPLIGALFARWTVNQEQFYILPALFAFSLMLIDILFVYFFLKETLPETKQLKSISSSWSQASHLLNPISLFKFSAVQNTNQKDKHLMQLLGATYFFYLFIFSGLEFTLTFFTHNRFGYTSMQQGKMFFVIGSAMAIVQGSYTRRIKPGREKLMIVQGMMLLIPAFGIIAFASSATLFYGALLLFAFAAGTVVPCLTTMISRYGGEDQKGAIMGIFRSLGALARAIGPFVACTVYWSFGSKFCYLIGGVSLFIPLFIGSKIKY